MTKRTTITAKRFTPVDLGNGKVITAIRTESRTMEYEATLDGSIIGYYERFSQAEAALDRAYAAHVEALPATTSSVVIAALEDLETEHRAYEATARAAGLHDEAKHWLRAANAYAKARLAYEAGVRPTDLGNRTYVLPSQRANGESHLLRFDGDFVCSCKSGAQIHWASALLHGIERAYEDVERFDSPAPEPAPLNLRAHGQRLAAARQQLLVAA